mgnify:FL=1
MNNNKINYKSLLHHGDNILFHIFCFQFPLVVEAPVVYVISGTDLTLNCEINGSIILTDQVSWKHNGVWLHNFTHRVDRKLQLVIPRIHEQQHGVYQCSVFNVSKQSVNLLPRDANVTVLIGGIYSYVFSYKWSGCKADIKEQTCAFNYCSILMSYHLIWIIRSLLLSYK